MVMGARRVILALSLLVVLPMVFSGCQKKGAFPNCKKDADCRVDANGSEVNAVCYMGKCEECVEDSDCSDLKQCLNNRCQASCQADADCGANSHCENSYCVADCSGDEGCGSGRTCAQGRCVAQGEGVNQNAWLSAGCQGITPVNFDFDSYEVKSEQRSYVDSLAQCLETNPGYSVVIEGHTDDRGTPSYNMALGQRRADAVRKYLNANKGIASSRLRTLSYGEQKPVMSEKSEYAWQQNRRAEFVLEQK